MATISDIMSENVITLPLSAPVAFAAKQMRDANVGVIVVTEPDAEDEPFGIVTDRDIIVRAVADGYDPTVPLGEVCSRDLTTLSPDDDVDLAVELMRERAVRRIPVVDEGLVVGIVSLGDLALQRDRQSVLGSISAAPPNH